MILLDEALTEAEDPQTTVTTRTEPAERNQSLVDGSPTRESNDRAHASPTSSPVPDRIRTTNKVKLPKLCLRKFEGDLTSWATFWDSFQSSIHLNPDLSSVDKFNYLHSLVDGIAAEAIAGLALTSSNYEEAIALLKKRFGNQQQQISKHMDILLHLEPLASPHNIKGLRHLFDKVEAQVRSLKALGVDPASFIVLNSFEQDSIRALPHQEVPQDKWEFEAILKIIERER